MINLCYTCLKWADKLNCPLYEHTPKYISVCSAFIHSGINITLKLQERIEELEKNANINNGNICSTNATTNDHEDRLNNIEKHWTRQQEDIDNINKNLDTLYENYRKTDERLNILEKQRMDFNWCGLRNDLDNLKGFAINQSDDKWGEIKKLEKIWSEQQGALDEAFNRLEHHSAFYERFVKLEKRMKTIEKHPIFEEIAMDNIIYYNSPLTKRFQRIEDKIKDLSLGNTTKILNQNKIVADYAELLAQNKLYKKVLNKFMKMFIKPLDAYDWSKNYRKVKELIRDLNR